MTVIFFVPGTPAPQGSKMRTRWGLIDDNAKTLKPWRNAVAATARSLDQQPLAGPVQADITVILQRPPSHYRTGRNAHLLKTTAPATATVAHSGDTDKYARAIFDGLTGPLLIDDVQVVEFTIRKQYTDAEQPHPGAWIYLTEAQEAAA